MTSCGLNDGPLMAEGVYSAGIACNLSNGHMPHISPNPVEESIPYITHDDSGHFIADIRRGTKIGFKYFRFSGPVMLKINVRGKLEGKFDVWIDGEHVGEIPVSPADVWRAFESRIAGGVRSGSLFLTYAGDGAGELLSIGFENL